MENPASVWEMRGMYLTTSRDYSFSAQKERRNIFKVEILNQVQDDNLWCSFFLL